MTKTCTKCHETKPVAEFSKCARARDGLKSQCKACDKIAVSVWDRANPGKRKARDAAWNKANPGKRKARSAVWYAENREKVKADGAARYAANPEKIKAVNAKWVSENMDKVKVIQARWDAANPDSRTIRNANRRARKVEAGGKLSKGLAERLFTLQRGKCACCGKSLGKDSHLDHIMPLALGGSNTDSNMQLLRGICNRQKSAKHPIDFMQQRGFLL